MNVVDKRKLRVSIKAASIPVGMVFEGVPSAGYEAFLFLRTYDSLVNLKNPNETWNNLSELTLVDYRPVGVEIHILQSL